MTLIGLRELGFLLLLDRLFSAEFHQLRSYMLNAYSLMLIITSKTTNNENNTEPVWGRLSDSQYAGSFPGIKHFTFTVTSSTCSEEMSLGRLEISTQTVQTYETSRLNELLHRCMCLYIYISYLEIRRLHSSEKCGCL